MAAMMAFHGRVVSDSDPARPNLAPFSRYGITHQHQHQHQLPSSSMPAPAPPTTSLRKSKYVPRSLVQHNYRDRSHELPDGTDLHSPVGVTALFPVKLHRALRDMSDDGLGNLCGWQPHGRAFVVRDHEEFEAVMPTYFGKMKFTSFQRQLNLYGFMRLTHGQDKGAYYHELFLRGREYLCHRIQRIRVKGTGARSASNPDAEPNFYRMPPVGPPGLCPPVPPPGDVAAGPPPSPPAGPPSGASAFPPAPAMGLPPRQVSVEAAIKPSNAMKAAAGGKKHPGEPQVEEARCQQQQKMRHDPLEKPSLPTSLSPPMSPISDAFSDDDELSLSDLDTSSLPVQPISDSELDDSFLDSMDTLMEGIEDPPPPSDFGSTPSVASLVATDNGSIPEPVQSGGCCPSDVTPKVTPSQCSSSLGLEPIPEMSQQPLSENAICAAADVSPKVVQLQLDSDVANFLRTLFEKEGAHADSNASKVGLRMEAKGALLEGSKSAVAFAPRGAGVFSRQKSWRNAAA